MTPKSVDADYFTEEVRRELLARYGEKALYESGLAVRTSLDPQLQTIADQALRDGLITYDRRHGWRGPVAHIERNAATGVAALVTVAPPAGTAEAGWSLAVVLGDQSDRARASALPTARSRQHPVRRDALGAQAAAGGRARTRAAPAERRAACRRCRAGRAARQRCGEGCRAAALHAAPDARGLRRGRRARSAYRPRARARSAASATSSASSTARPRRTRQPGSAIKPFVYLTAHGSRLHAVDAWCSTRPSSSIRAPGLPKWKPSNYDA